MTLQAHTEVLSRFDFEFDPVVVAQAAALAAGAIAETVQPRHEGRGPVSPDEERTSIRALGPRERQIASLLVQGCSNAEIATELKMAKRTVKAHFNRLFLRFRIANGIKRVRLAVMLYRSGEFQ
jgi:DNA-binding NarL/FixJ family response regulator